MPPPSGRRRRADAERSIAAILDSAARILGRDPQASVDEIAKAAGTSRQTVYAHFPSRDALVGALIDRTTERVVAALEAAELDDGPASAALLRFVETGWHAFEGDPFLLNLATPPQSAAEELDRHRPILTQLTRVIERGQREGDFDPRLPVTWVLAATVALGHAAGEEVRAGRMAPEQAHTVLQLGLTRLFRAQ